MENIYCFNVDLYLRPKKFSPAAQLKLQCRSSIRKTNDGSGQASGPPAEQKNGLLAKQVPEPPGCVEPEG